MSVSPDAAPERADDISSSVAPATSAAFQALGLAPELLRAVADLGFTQPTPVQLAAIPRALPSRHGADAAPSAAAGTPQGASQSDRPDGLATAAPTFCDLMVSSQTGSGKTAAFLLPVLHTLLDMKAEQIAAERAERERREAEALAQGKPAPKAPKRRNPLNARHFQPAVPGALVLCPTRELAQQVASDAIDLVRHCRGLRIAHIVGGMPYAMQIQKLQNADLVVATPGRLLDLQRSGQVVLDSVRFLVVDEADRMLDLGFTDDLAEVNRLTARRAQTMMFSATFAPRIQQLAMRVMRDQGRWAQRVQIDQPQDRHTHIRQELYWADDGTHKRRLLDHWLRDASIEQAIVFASTQIECDALAEDLQQAGFSAVALHGALSQGLRNRRLGALRDGRVQILVATDVAARGIDVPTISHVFNYGLPMKAEDYVHRIGRTGRAGRHGLAVTMAEPRDRRRIGDIEAYNRQRLEAKVIAGLEPRRPVAPSMPPAGRGHGRFDSRGSGRGDGRPGAPRAGAPAGAHRGAPRGERAERGFASFGRSRGRG